MSLSTVKLAEAHEKGLEKKRAQLAELDQEIEDLTTAERVAMADWIRMNPSKSPDATSQIGRYRSKIADAVGRRERLVGEISAQKQLYEELEGQANAEQAAAQLTARNAEIKQTADGLAEAWQSFVKACEEVEGVWEAVVELAHKLDALPAGEAPVTLPTNLKTAFLIALAVPGQEPFASSSRLTTKRLATTGGSAAVDTRGFATTMSQTGTY